MLLCLCFIGVEQIQQLPTTRTKMQQGVQTDAICNIQQFWELLGNNELRLFAWGLRMFKFELKVVTL